LQVIEDGKITRTIENWSGVEILLDIIDSEKSIARGLYTELVDKLQIKAKQALKEAGIEP